MTPEDLLSGFGDLHPHDRLGPYELLLPAGRGGMALVWLARHVTPTALGQGAGVALKTMLPALRADPRFAKMFLAEGSIAARIEHPNVVRVFDVGEDHGHLYLAMEWIDGDSLSMLSRQSGGRLPCGVAVRIAHDAALGLHAAHSLRDHAGRLCEVVHRDVSPNNLLVGEDGRCRVVDFGVSKSVGGEPLTEPGRPKGTVAYMSPEQAFSEDVDARADVFALGVVLYEASVGRHPFRGASQIVTLSNVATADPVRPRDIDPAYPASLEAVVLKALCKERDGRHATMAELAEELAAVMDSIAGSSRADVAAFVSGVGWASGARRRAAAVKHALGGVARSASAWSATALEASRALDIPRATTELVGRESLLAEVKSALSTARVVTLIGPAGAGKSRLAVQVAAELAPELEGSVHFVALAPLRDPEHVLPALARALGVAESRDVQPAEAVADRLRGRRALVVLDNFEHLLAAAPAVEHVLRAADGVRVLVTSRARLHLEGERVMEVLPLEVPAAGRWAPEALQRIPAAAMFVGAARHFDPTFAVTPSNADAIAEIVRRLEGLPLAIELAAARLRSLPPRHLLDRLDERFRLLRGGASDVPHRQRTLRSAVAWSHELLDQQERSLFARLGVFVGGFAPDSVEAVADGDPVDDVAATLASLVDKSLVQRSVRPGGVRYTMLESIREFALDTLAPEETRILGQRHARHFAALALEAAPGIKERDGKALAALTLEEGNLRAALRFSLEAPDVELGLRLAGAMWRYWHAAGRMMEGRRWLDELVARGGAPRMARADGLAALANLAYWQADYGVALERYAEALGVFRSTGDKARVAETLFAMSTTHTWNGDPSAGERLAGEARSLFEELGDRRQVGEALMAQGFARWMSKDLAGARPLWEQSRAIALEAGDVVEASSKSLALAALTFQEGRAADALARALDAMDDLHGLSNSAHTVMAIDFVAAIAVAARPEQGVTLAGAASALRIAQGGGMRPEACGLESARAIAARSLDEASIGRAWSAGRTLTLQDAVITARTLRPDLLEGPSHDDRFVHSHRNHT